MAHTRAGNVIRVTSSEDFSDRASTTAPYVNRVDHIKYIGAASATAEIRKENSSGNLLWEQAGDVIQSDSISIRAGGDGISVVITNGAVVYLYLGDSSEMS